MFDVRGAAGVTDLDGLSPAALAAAMKGGTESWGRWGSATQHISYVEEIAPPTRRRCWCGCKRKRTHRLMANGMCLSQGCELHMHRLAKEANERRKAAP